MGGLSVRLIFPFIACWELVVVAGKCTERVSSSSGGSRSYGDKKHEGER